MFQDKPLIALSCTSNHDPLPSRIISNPMAYSNAIAAGGGIPVYAPECLPTDYAGMCDGLLLTGGMDIDPTWFGEEALNDSVELDALRDPYEFELCKAFLARKKADPCHLPRLPAHKHRPRRRPLPGPAGPDGFCPQ